MSACSHLSARTCACSCPRARTCALPYSCACPPACERRSRKRIASVKPSVNSPRKAANNRQLSTEATITTPHRSTPQMYENHVEIYSDPKFGRPSANSIGFAHIPTKATSRHSSKRGSELGFYNSSVNLDAKPFPRVQFLTRKSVQNVTYSQMQDDFLDLEHLEDTSGPETAEQRAPREEKLVARHGRAVGRDRLESRNRAVGCGRVVRHGRAVGRGRLERRNRATRRNRLARLRQAKSRKAPYPRASGRYSTIRAAPTRANTAMQPNMVA